MALSAVDKMRRSQVLAVAVQVLRKERLKTTQEDLAELIGGNCDEGSIRRWERGEFAPTAATRKRLASISRKHGWGDLVTAFEGTLQEWRALLLRERDRHWLALFELILLNQPTMREDIYNRVPRREYAGLIKALRTTARSMKGKAGSVSQIIPGLRRGVWMVTDEQVAAWQQETSARAVKAAKAAMKGARQTNPDRIIIHFEDGRVEVFENDAAMNRAIARYRAEKTR